MNHYHKLAVYDARVAIVNLIDQKNVQREMAAAVDLFFKGGEADRIILSQIELWSDLLEVVEKWAARQGAL